VSFRFLNSLQLKLAAGFLLVSLVPLGIVGSFSVRTADGLIESIVTNQLENMAAEKQQLLQRWIAERRADLEVVAASAVVKGTDPAAIDPYLKSMQSQYEVYSRFVVAGPSGQVIYDSGGPAQPRPSLRSERATPASEETWYRRAMRGERYMSPVHLDADDRLSVFQLAAPICDAAGRPQGAVCATVNTAGILRWVLRVSLGETGECYLVDKTGTFLAHQDPNRVLKDNIAESESFSNIFRAGGPQPIYNDYRSIAVLGASRAIPDTEWYVVVEQDQDEAFAPAYQLRRHILIAVILTVAGAVGLSLWLAYYVSAPIRDLSEAAHALARGDFESPLIHTARKRRDEIGMLRSAFEEMADQLRDRQSQLQTRVGLTEVELQQAGIRLQDTMKAAERSEHLAALGRLASGVAHEIRTPLASLKLYLQSVQEDITISPELSEDFEVAMRQVERIEGTINHFLNFARPQDPIFVDVDFERLIDDALMVIRPRANHQGVEMDVRIAPALPKVRGDMRQLGEAVVNLLLNALEELPEGGRLQIGVEPDARTPDDSPASWVRIDITDDGPGIKQEDLGKLFEPFFTTKATGSGLGLTIVHGTVQRHGGIVRVRTALGAGTTFSLFLPAAAV
jgi:two-component system, NtrC family, sensor kinase